MASSQIIPHFEAKGVDVCGFNKKKIIVRSDFGIYIETDTFWPGTTNDVLTHPLHSRCRNGDHYIATDTEDMPESYGSVVHRVLSYPITAIT